MTQIVAHYKRHINETETLFILFHLYFSQKLAPLIFHDSFNAISFENKHCR